MKGQSSNSQVMARRAGKFMLGAVMLTMSMLHTPAHAQALTSFTDGVTSSENVLAVDPATSEVATRFCIDGVNGGCTLSQNWLGTEVGPGSSTAFFYSPLTSFSDAFGDHVFFVDNHQSLNQISGRLSQLAVNFSSINLGVQSTGGMSGYSSPGEFTLASSVLARLFYETSDQHVHMLASSNGGSFADSDLTRWTGGTLARPGSDFTSFHDDSGEHVFYLGANQHVYQLYGSWISYYICNPITRICGPVSYIQWANQDLTSQANGPLVLAGLSSFKDTTGQHVFYVAKDFHIHELNYASAGWADQDLTINARAILPYSAGPVTGLASLSNALGQQLFYFGTDLNLHEIVLNNSGGADVDLGPMTNPCYGLQLTSVTRTGSKQVESDVFYVAGDENIHRLSQVATKSYIGSWPIWLTGSWTDLGLDFFVANRCIQ